MLLTPPGHPPLQASEAELRVALKERGALELKGLWQVVEAGFLGTLLEVMLATIVQEGWPRWTVPLQPLVDAVAPEGFEPRWALRQIWEGGLKLILKTESAE